jgi:hypothetical protein
MTKKTAVAKKPSVKQPKKPVVGTVKESELGKDWSAESHLKSASTDLEKSEVYLLDLMTTKEAKDLPPNPDGENGVRAEKAVRALAHFVKVGNGKSVDQFMGELIASLMHYADRAGVSFESALQDGRFNYQANTGAFSFWRL